MSWGVVPLVRGYKFSLSMSWSVVRRTWLQVLAFNVMECGTWLQVLAFNFMECGTWLQVLAFNFMECGTTYVDTTFPLSMSWGVVPLVRGYKFSLSISWSVVRRTWIQRSRFQCHGVWNVATSSRFQFHGVWYDVRGYNVPAFNVMGCGTAGTWLQVLAFNVMECGTWLQVLAFNFMECGTWLQVLAFNFMECGTTYVDTTFSLSMSWSVERGYKFSLSISWGMVRRTWIQRSRFQCHGVWYRWYVATSSRFQCHGVWNVATSSRFQFHGVWYDVRGYNVPAFNFMECGTTYVDTTFPLSISWSVVRRTWIQGSRFQCHGVWNVATSSQFQCHWVWYVVTKISLSEAAISTNRVSSVSSKSKYQQLWGGCDVYYHLQIFFLSVPKPLLQGHVVKWIQAYEMPPPQRTKIFRVSPLGFWYEFNWIQF